MKTTILILLALIVTFSAGYFAGGHFSKSPSVEENADTLYAVADGKKILARDVADRVESDVRLLRKSEYLLKKRAVESYLIEKLSSPGLGGNEYSQAEFDRFLSERKLDYSKMSEKAQSDTLGNFKLHKRALAKKTMVQNVEWHIPMNFVKQPIDVGPGFLPDLEAKDAGPKIVVFANYHCPYCAEAQRKIQSLRQKYDDKVSIKFRFSMDEPESSIVYMSALAAGCAADQSKFIEMHDALFAKTPMTEEQLSSVAASVKLNMTQFSSCLASKKHGPQVRKDVAEAEGLGINRQAVIYVNGSEFQAQEPFEEMDSLLK